MEKKKTSVFRMANQSDLGSITAIYDKIHTQEEAGLAVIGWNRSIYPTFESADEAVRAKEMFVMEVCGNIVASGKINREQVPEYALAAWEYDAADEEIMVLHTLTVDPDAGGRGYAKEFVRFYEKYALEHGCSYLRMDTNERNTRARNLYSKLGYKEVGTVPCTFNGIEGVRLVCLEKKVN